MRNVIKKRKNEKRVVTQMIQLYCRKKHRSRNSLCAECQALCDYASRRVDRCPFMETKSFCSNCKVHCYKPEMREKIKLVMCFSGPRMLLYHPVTAVRHAISLQHEKKRLNHQ